MNGAPVAAHLGREVKEMFPDWYPKFEPYLLRVLNGESIIEFEIFRQTTKPGETDHTALASYEPAWDEADEVIGVSVAVMDITQRREAQRALSEIQDSNALQQHAAGYNRQVPWIMDADGNSIQVSSLWVPATKLSGAKSEILDGLRLCTRTIWRP